MTTRSVFGALALLAVMAWPLAAGPSCESLTALKLSHAVIASAKLVPAGPYGGPPSPFQPPSEAPPPAMPAYCDVRGVARPTSDSEINFVVWLPLAGWNGKYRQQGNGGWSGTILQHSMVDPLRRGYATAATDDGHQGGPTDASWAIGHPEKLVDFGHRAVHETRVQASAIIRAFYGKDPAHAYFVGCSNGGRQGLMEAQRYADDFDGILSGAPANDWSRQFTAFVWDALALPKEGASAIPAAKLPAIQQAALGACDALDGVTDGLVEDPRTCRFDPGILTCKGADATDCLTVAQTDALRKVYGGPRDPRTGEALYPGYPPGAEAVPGGWGTWVLPVTPAGSIALAFGNSYYAQAVFEDPSWDYRTLDFDRDVAFGATKVGSQLDATSPDLRSFRARGGKLIQYHGWGDPAIVPGNSIRYYETVKQFLASHPDPRSNPRAPVESFYRLFMVPGMAHCGGGIGPNAFGNLELGGVSSSVDPERDIFSALERWVETGVAPERLIGSGITAGDPRKTMTRPLCPYPQVARYRGTGDPNDAGSYTCGIPDVQ